MSDPEFFSTTYAADEAGLSPATARSWAVEHDLPRVGQTIVWQREDIDDLISDYYDSDDDEPEVEEDEPDPE